MATCPSNRKKRKGSHKLNYSSNFRGKRLQGSRNQHHNKEDALKEISKRVNEFYRTGHVEESSEERRDQIGKGERSDKRRTYRVKDGVVTDHITNKTANFKEIMKGKLELLS